MIRDMHIEQSQLSLIKLGEKTIELRLFDAKRRNLHIGDIIRFISLSDENITVITKVTCIRVFKSFEDLYAVLPLLRCGYTLDNVDSASPKDMEKYYSLEDQEKFGVVAIEIELLNKSKEEQ